jgi:hypothetical protein
MSAAAPQPASFFIVQDPLNLHLEAADPVSIMPMDLGAGDRTILCGSILTWRPDRDASPSSSRKEMKDIYEGGHVIERNELVDDVLRSSRVLTESSRGSTLAGL